MHINRGARADRIAIVEVGQGGRERDFYERGRWAGSIRDDKNARHDQVDEQTSVRNHESRTNEQSKMLAWGWIGVRVTNRSYP
jgi:hypothetical protein